MPSFSALQAIRGPLPALALLLAAGCGGGIRVVTNYDPAAGPVAETYRTWGWLPEPAGREPPGGAARLEEFRGRVADAFVARGFRRAEPDSAPDFLVGIHLLGEEPVTVPEVNMVYGYTWGRWFPGGGVVFSGGYRTELPAGALVVDVADGRARELVWRGIAPLELHRPPPPDRARVAEALRRMLERFPPR